jgi:protein O-GlcNAc transferase
MDSIRNMKKNVIAYSLWGDHPMYWKGALRNIEQAKKYFPGWVCRFYIDDSSNPDLIKSLESTNSEIFLIKREDGIFSENERFNHSGLFWRFKALEDSEIGILLSRDCDSRFSDREIWAIKQWIESDKDFHIMRDHPYHAVPILTGMWGARNGILSNISELLGDWKKFSGKGRYQAEDQDFLGQMVYPLVMSKSLEHSEFGISYGGQITNFPKPRIDYEFVGDVFDENDVRHPDHWRILTRY